MTLQLRCLDQKKYHLILLVVVVGGCFVEEVEAGEEEEVVDEAEEVEIIFNILPHFFVDQGKCFDLSKVL